VTGQADSFPEETPLIDASEILDLAHRQIAELKQQVAELTAELATERASLASLGREFIELHNNLDSKRSHF
jgi:hypothetical protein